MKARRLAGIVLAKAICEAFRAAAPGLFLGALLGLAILLATGSSP